MALKVGELYATMKLDNKGFDAGLDTSKSKFMGLDKALKAGAQAGARVFAATTAAVVGLGVAALKVGLDYNRMQQSSRAALTTLLGSAEAANAQMDKLDEFAKTSPFAKQVFIQAQQQLIGFGMAADDVLPTLDAIQNAVAAVGGSNEDISEITRVLAQVTSSGKITAETFNQLGARGIDAATIIGESMGKTGAEIRDSVTKGTLDADVAVKALTDGMMVRFGGATANIKQQMDGAADRVKGAWRDIGSVMATPLIDPTGGGQLVEWTNLFADGLRAIEKQAEPVTAILWGRMGPGIDLVTEGLRRANATISGWNAKSLETSLDKLSGYGPLIAGTSAALFAMGTSNLPVLSALGISGINPVVAGMVALVATSPQLRNVGRDLLEALKPALTPAKELGVVLADFLMEAINTLAPSVGRLAVAGADLGVVFLSALIPAATGLVTAATPLVGVVADMVDAFAGLPTPLLAGVAAFAAFKTLGLPTMFNGLAKSTTGFFKGFTEQMALQTHLAGLGGTELSKFGAVAATASARISGLGMAMKVAFISNAPLLAITALVTVLGFFAQKSAEAKARADSYAAALDGVTSAADKTAAAAKHAQNALVTGENADWGWWQKMQSGFESAADALEHFGQTAEGAGNAVAGTQAEFDAYIENIREAGTVNGYLDGAAGELITTLHQQRNALSAAERMAIQKARADEDAAAAADEHSAALKAQRDAVDRLISAEATLAAAKGDLVSAQYASKDAIDAWNQAAAESGKVTRDNSGAIDASTESYRAFDEAAVSAQQAMVRELEAMQKAGASQSELDAKRQASIETQRAAIEAWGLEGDEVDAYVDRIGGIPEFVSTKVDADTLDAYQDLEALIADIAAKHGVLTIDARNDPAVAKLMEALGLVDDGSGVFTVDANTDPATAALLASLGVVDTSTGTVTIDANDEPTIKRLAEAEAAINRTDGTVSILGKDKTGPVRDEAKRRIDQTTGTIPIYGRDHATGEADRIVGIINRKTATITIGAVATRTAMVALANADGAVYPQVRAFANGSENHVAQIAPAGAWRIWAEDETGGEAYIPLALSKRARSLEILEDVAQRFGRVTVPTGVRSFADGGTTTRTPASGGVTTNTYQVTAMLDPTKVRTLDDLVRWVDGLSLESQLRGV